MKQERRKYNMPDNELLLWMQTQVMIDPVTECQEWIRFRDEDGYGQLGYKGEVVYTHRLVWELHTGTNPKDKILHTCNTPSCININHLREGSAQDSVDDMVMKGRDTKAIGEKHGGARLTEQQVMLIRSLYSSVGHTQRDLANTFGVSHTTIRSIINRKTWTHI